MQTNVQAVTYNEHYDKLLAPVYTWMAGGVEAAFSRGNNSTIPGTVYRFI
jgi:hypothetical protein